MVYEEFRQSYDLLSSPSTNTFIVMNPFRNSKQIFISDENICKAEKLFTVILGCKKVPFSVSKNDKLSLSCKRNRTDVFRYKSTEIETGVRRWYLMSV